MVALANAPPCPCDCKPAPPPAATIKGGTTCTVRLAGVSVSTARSLRLVVGGTRYELTGLQAEVQIAGERATASIVDERFAGSRELVAASCKAGPVTLKVRPKPARVTFTSVPDDVAVICREGCPADLLDKPQTLASFPTIDMDAVEKWITVELKHPDYRPKTMTTRVVPGPNRIDAAMTPRCPG